MQEALVKLETLDPESIGTDLQVAQRRRTVYWRTTPASSSSSPSPSWTWLFFWPHQRVLEQGPRSMSRSLSSSLWCILRISLLHRRQLVGLHQDEGILFRRFPSEAIFLADDPNRRIITDNRRRESWHAVESWCWMNWTWSLPGPYIGRPPPPPRLRRDRRTSITRRCRSTGPSSCCAGSARNRCFRTDPPSFRISLPYFLPENSSLDEI